MKAFFFFLSFLIAAPALAGSWPVQKLSPGGYISYSWDDSGTDSEAPNLDARTCASLSIGYEDNILGAAGVGAMRVYSCPSPTAALALCEPVTAAISADDVGQSYTARPGWLLVDVTATGAGEIARVNIFCSRLVGP